MKLAIDKITGNVVRVLRATTSPDGRCVVIRHPDGSEQIQFKSLLIGL